MNSFKNLRTRCKSSEDGSTDYNIAAELCLDEMHEAGLKPNSGFAESDIPLENLETPETAHFVRGWEDWRLDFVGGVSRGVLDIPPEIKALHKRGDIDCYESHPGWASTYTMKTQEALNLMVKAVKAL